MLYVANATARKEGRKEGRKELLKNNNNKKKKDPLLQLQQSCIFDTSKKRPTRQADRQT
jgi:hypothetical protein